MPNIQKEARFRNIPDDILNNVELNRDIETLLPGNYNFEIHKTINRVRKVNAKTVVLQMPEGLVIFASSLIEILRKHSYENEIIDVELIEDPSYGACCIEEPASVGDGYDLLIHYGHSCLIPIQSLRVFYVFVEIKIDMKHFVDTIIANFPQNTDIALVSTIQFVSILHSVKEELSKKFEIVIPKIAPLSPGEILGCTAPKVDNVDCMLYLGDGRFHIESAMIANPELPIYKYDPYVKKITKEYYHHDEMRRNRLEAIEKAKKAQVFGLIHGTLGRQGSPEVTKTLERLLNDRNIQYELISASEISLEVLSKYHGKCDAFIQNACPRLSIDWGHELDKPILTPYEAAVTLGVAEWLPGGRYPTDFYAYDSLGAWTPNYRSSSARPRKHIRVGSKPVPDEVIQL